MTAYNAKETATNASALAWLYTFANENHKGDVGLALLELELEGLL